MVGVEVTAWRGMKTRRAEAFPALVSIPAPHGIHIGRRATKVTDITLEVGHACHLASFA